MVGEWGIMGCLGTAGKIRNTLIINVIIEYPDIR